MGKTKFIKVPILKSDVITKNNDIFSKEALEKLKGQSAPVTLDFDGEKIGDAKIVSCEEGVLMADIQIDSKFLSSVNGLYPAPGMTVSDKDIVTKDGVDIINGGIFTSIGLCSSHADPSIPPLKDS